MIPLYEDILDDIDGVIDGLVQYLPSNELPVHFSVRKEFGGIISTRGKSQITKEYLKRIYDILPDENIYFYLIIKSNSKNSPFEIYRGIEPI